MALPRELPEPAAAFEPSPPRSRRPAESRRTAALVELRAAAMLVATGAVRRITVANVRAWPGWPAASAEIALEHDVLIVPIAQDAPGRVDFVVKSSESR